MIKTNCSLRRDTYGSPMTISPRVSNTTLTLDWNGHEHINNSAIWVTVTTDKGMIYTQKVVVLAYNGMQE